MNSGNKASEVIRKILFIAIIIAAVIGVIVLVATGVDNYKSKKLIEKQKEMHTTVITQPPVTTAPPVTETTVTETEREPLEVLPAMQTFIDENKDTAGWIKINNTSVDNVVVQSEDNNYYLDKDFNGNNSQGGTVYLDYRCVANDYDDNQSDNLILYGHNQKNGTMFGTLKNYKIKKSNTKNFEFYKNNPTFYFSNNYEEYTYKIIAMFVIEVEPSQTRDGKIFDYHNYINFNDTTRSFDEWKQNILMRTEVNTGVDFNEDDQFMTLSTCSNEFEPSRFVVIGRKVRKDESSDVDTSKAELNEDVKEPDWNYIYNK